MVGIIYPYPKLTVGLVNVPKWYTPESLTFIIQWKHYLHQMYVTPINVCLPENAAMCGKFKLVIGECLSHVD